MIRHYSNPALPKTTVEIEGTTFEIVKFPVSISLGIFNKSVTTLAPLGDAFGFGGKNKKEVEINFSKIAEINDEKVTKQIIELCQMCKNANDDRMVIFDVDMKSLKMPYLLAFEFLKWNFEDFLLGNLKLAGLAKAVTGIDLGKMKQK